VPVSARPHVHYQQAVAWFEKAAAQDDPEANRRLGNMHFDGEGVTRSWRRAREYYDRAEQLGSINARHGNQVFKGTIARVTSNRSHHPSTSHTPVTSDAFSAPL